MNYQARKMAASAAVIWPGCDLAGLSLEHCAPDKSFIQDVGAACSSALMPEQD